MFRSMLYIYLSILVSTDFVGRYPVWKSGRAAGSPFTVKVKVHYPEETIKYLFKTCKSILFIIIFQGLYHAMSL